MRHTELREGHGWIGSNGDQHWVVPPGASLPVLVSGSAEGLRGPPLAPVRPLLLGDQHLLRLPVALALFETGYSLSASRFADDPNRVRIDGRRQRRGPSPNPDQFELDIEADTARCLHLTMFWHMPRPPSDPPRRVDLRRIEVSPTPPNWYEHQTHHGVEREVIHR
jgi:hypothetical protein